MNSRLRLNCAGNRDIFSGINSDLCKLSNHIFFVFLFTLFWAVHFTNHIYWLYIGTNIEGIHKGQVVGGWDGYLEGEIARGSISHG